MLIPLLQISGTSSGGAVGFITVGIFFWRFAAGFVFLVGLFLRSAAGYNHNFGQLRVRSFFLVGYVVLFFWWRAAGYNFGQRGLRSFTFFGYVVLFFWWRAAGYNYNFWQRGCSFFGYIVSSITYVHGATGFTIMGIFSWRGGAAGFSINILGKGFADGYR